MLPSLSSARPDERVLTPLDAWVRQPDVSARLVDFSEQFSQLLEGPSTSRPSQSATTVKSPSLSSMAPALLHHSNASTHSPPSLRSYFTNTEATPTESSVSTGLASHLPGLPLLEENNGILEIPPAPLCATPLYECAFWFLNCGYVSHNREEWEGHCAAHFRGEEPPHTVQCPLCDWTVTHHYGWTAWALRMQHLASQHTMRGQTLQTSRPDFHLFRFLWQRRLIDDQDLKELNGGNHNLTHAPGAYVETSGRRRERDGRRHRTQPVRAPRSRHHS